MRIRDLPAPVTASKADWLPGTTWIGFTPSGKGSGAEARCQSTVQRQLRNGYVIERVTLNFGVPNAAFADDPVIRDERERHARLRDRLVAVHRLRHSARPLQEIIGGAEFERLQDVWSIPGERNRWSVAFPIIESFQIVGQPAARDIFSKAVFRRLYRSQSAVLRPFDDEARQAIAELELIRTEAPNAWIAVADEIEAAERSELPASIEAAIGHDLKGAMEGENEEHRRKLRSRASWLAHRFVIERSKAGRLICDDCGLDPRLLPNNSGISLRSCFDVHHRRPLDEGRRYTTFEDLSLLCPTCHRLTHLRLARDAESVIFYGSE